MGNGVSANQGNLPSYGSRDVKTSVCRGQHDWLEQAEAPETHLLSTTRAKSYMCPLRGIKCPHLILGLVLPKKFWAKKHSFQLAILRYYCRYLQIGTRYNQLENGAA